MKNFFKNTPCIILLGGIGSRYSKLNEPPKQLIKISRKTLLENILEGFIKNDISIFIFPLGNKKKFFLDFFKKKKKILDRKLNVISSPRFVRQSCVNIILFDSGRASSKLTRIKKSLNYSNLNNFFVTYGDGLANINFFKYKKRILKSNKNFFVVKKIKSQYGHLILDNSKNLKSFIEKPLMNDPVNIGYYFFNKKSFISNYNSNFELESKFINKLIRRKQIDSFYHDGYFFNIDKKIDLANLKKNYKDILKFL